MDPDGRMLMLSCGVALHHAIVALHAAGRTGSIERIDDPRRPDLVAVLRAGETVPADDTVYRALLRRRTDRRPFADAAPTPGDLVALCEAAERHGTRPDMLTTEQIPAFADLVDRAAARLRADAALSARSTAGHCRSCGPRRSRSRAPTSTRSPVRRTPATATGSPSRPQAARAK
jgi:hypothetical protein